MYKCTGKETMTMWTVKEQYALHDEILKERIHCLMPQLMKECGVEMWVVISREYNEDPVFPTLVPSLVKNASRTTCLVFCLDGEGNYEALNVSRPNPRFDGFYTQAMNRRDDVFEALNHLIARKKPSRVHVDISNECAIADGLSKNLYDHLQMALNGSVPLVSAEEIVIRWIETRTRRELEIYPEIYRMMMDIVDDVFSGSFIHPGVTTTTDVEWGIMQRVNDLGLPFWFAPDVDLQRKGSADSRMSGVVIEEGDIVHCDVGLICLGLHTDTQRNVYIGRKGETEIPEGIRAAFRTGNRFQDIVRGQYKAGRTGNEIFASSLEMARSEGVQAMSYCHPIGTFGHSAGPCVGMYDNQGFVPGHGELVMHDDTCYALELNIAQKVPEWDDQLVYMYLEETVAFTGGETCFMDDKREIIRFVPAQ